MNRIEIETKLNRDRAWLIETYADMSEEDLNRPATRSEHDKTNMWSAKDHLAHLALIEFNFVQMVRRHIAGDANPVALTRDNSGRARSRDAIMANVHAMTEDWAVKHRDMSLTDIVKEGQLARSETLKLMSELSDEQLLEKLPGAPWSDGTVGGVLSVHADHGRGHYRWVKEGWASQE